MLGAVVLVAALAVGFTVLASGLAQAEIPHLVGIDSRMATQELEDLKLVPEVRYRSDPTPKGRVLATDPPADSTRAKGETVVLYVSAGPDTRAVPVVRGAKRAEAERRLRAAGLSVDVDQVPVSDADQDGVAIGTDPPAGTALPPGASVHLRVGVSPEAPPDPTTDTRRPRPTPPTSHPLPTPTPFPPPRPPPRP